MAWLAGLHLKQATMYLKLGKEEDASDVVELARDLFNHSVYSTLSTFDPVEVKENYLESLERPGHEITNILLCSVHSGHVIGLLCGAATPLAFSKDKLAVELCFWVYKEHRTSAALKKLLEAYYYWARAVGCKAAVVGKIKNRDEIETYKVKKLWQQH